MKLNLNFFSVLFYGVVNILFALLVETAAALQRCCNLQLKCSLQFAGISRCSCCCCCRCCRRHPCSCNVIIATHNEARTRMQAVGACACHICGCVLVRHNFARLKCKWIVEVPRLQVANSAVCSLIGCTPATASTAHTCAQVKQECTAADFTRSRVL